MDRVNRPDRPLPSDRISVAGLRALFLAFTAAGLASSALLGPAVLALAALLRGVALLYNVRLKELGILGNPAVPFYVSMTVVLGGTAAGAVNGLVLTLGAPSSAGSTSPGASSGSSSSARASCDGIRRDRRAASHDSRDDMVECAPMAR